jgi:hypothetical protein
LLASLASLAGALAIALSAPLAHADEPAPSQEESVGLRGPRIGLTPGFGVGVAGFTGPVPFTSTAFMTELRLEALLEFERVGFFVRGGYYSAGPELWNGPLVAVGAQYRLRGDGEEHWGFVLRGGALYEHWNAVQGGCDVFYFIPNGCQDFAQAPPLVPGQPLPVPPPSLSVDAFGLLAAFRVEVPVQPIFLAFDAEVTGAADVDKPAVPGAIFTGEVVLTIALRDHIRKNNNPTRWRRRFYTQ